ncbi:hypothetical protein [Haloglomus salinum]|uniref:hypothetical protein n=1 Tax=Haloglomus salinum TaxID=2962673 RepID=UPI0020C9FB94|nr:hypothetical protein [Haloglomus salinum]
MADIERKILERDIPEKIEHERPYIRASELLKVLDAIVEEIETEWKVVRHVSARQLEVSSLEQKRVPHALSWFYRNTWVLTERSENAGQNVYKIHPRLTES